MTRNQQTDLSILSGILMIPGWYAGGTGLTLLVAFVPLLLVEAHLVKTVRKGSRYFWLPFISFLLFNLGTLWWIKNVFYIGLFIAVLLNTSLMSLTFWMFSKIHRKFGDYIGYASLVVIWIAFEFIYLNGEISFTWLNLGNGFANDIKLVQWYEYTGALGGTAWILISNILFLFILKNRKNFAIKKTKLHYLVLSGLIIVLPITISLIIYYTYEESSEPVEIVVLQPNIDPYLKFNDIPASEQMDILMNLADSLVTSTTEFVIAPETFLNDNLLLDSLHSNPEVQRIKGFVEKHPAVNFIFGATVFRRNWQDSTCADPSPPYFGNSCYNSFNAAIQFDTTNLVQDYFKSKLVTGVEKLPYVNDFKLLRKLMLNLGGTFRSHQIQESRESFISIDKTVKTGTIICFESVFGEFVTEYVKEADANLLFIITNDGWWGDTPGHKQHNSFASLRAVENRRSIARSANTGISCLINQKGEITKKIEWWKRSAISGNLNCNQKKTFYTLYGDFMGRIAFCLSVILILALFFVRKNV